MAKGSVGVENGEVKIAETGNEADGEIDEEIKIMETNGRAGNLAHGSVDPKRRVRDGETGEVKSTESHEGKVANGKLDMETDGEGRFAEGLLSANGAS